MKRERKDICCCDSISVGGPVNAISLSPEKTLAAVAGREVFKIVSLVDSDHLDSLKPVANFRVGKMNLNYSSLDVKWHPMNVNKDTIATAATNGAVVIWNAATVQQSKVINDHSQTVNRIAWHEDHPFTLLSCSQSGAIKLWDIRDYATNSKSFGNEAYQEGPVRDIKFNRVYLNYFAAGFDSGIVQIWDIRMNRRYKNKVLAHEGPVFTMDWHYPDEKNTIATGGRDSYVKVWDLSDASVHNKPTYSIKNMGSVAQVSWRPNHPLQLASLRSLDRYVQVFEVKKPFIPKLYFKSTEMVTSLAWINGDSVVFGTRDGVLKRCRSKHAYFPHRNLCAVGVSWSPSGKLTFCNDTQNHEASRSKEGLSSFFAFAKSKAPVKSRVLHTLYFVAPTSSLEIHLTLKQLAKKYLLSPDPGAYGSDPVLTFSDICEHNSKLAASMKLHSVAQLWEFIKLFAAEVKGESPLASPVISSGVRALLPSNLFGERLDSSPPPIPPEKNPFGSQEPPEGPLSQHIFQFDEDLHVPRQLERTSERRGKKKSVSHKINLKKKGQHFEEIFRDELLWDVEKFLVETLTEFADEGDVQTPAIMTIVLGDRIKIDKHLSRRWIMAYVDLLEHLQLWKHATHVRILARDRKITSQTQAGTLFALKCPHCNAALEKDAWKCERCKKISNRCAICHEPCRGLYAWCQGCGHGGHLHHMKDWSRVSNLCPTGCGHTCIKH